MLKNTQSLLPTAKQSSSLWKADFSFIRFRRQQTMAETTWDDIRRLHTEFLNLQMTETSNRYAIWGKS